VGNMDKLWRQYVETRSSELRRQLVESYAPLARYVVDRLNLRPGRALEYDDLLSQAIIGLIDAVDRFDPSRGVKFETYAYHRIRGAVMDMLRDLDWLPRSVRQREAELTTALTRLESKLGRAPTDEEIARDLGITIAQFDALAYDLALQAMYSLEEMIGGPASESSAIGDLVADDNTPTPEAQAERQAERDILASAIDALPEAERIVVSLYYYEGLTLKEVGRVLGVTESRACQIHGKAMIRLRSQVHARLETSASADARSSGKTNRRIDSRYLSDPAGV